jgi:zinc protease
MRRFSLFVLGLLALRLSAATPFPQAASDLAPDPAARYGALPNGLRYVILPNREPKNRASLRLLVLSGSLEEKEDQRGLAHFLEHMAFNGSTHNPPGTLVEYFQRLGMSFGGDTNAYTDFGHTAFEIELPDTRAVTVARGLQVFADFAGGLLLRPEMIEKERPIILSEKRTRDSVEFREFVASYEFELAGTLFPQRIPIGLQSVIEKAQRDRFLDLYNTWYRPERMAVIVVGNIQTDAVERQIAEAFAGVADRAPARPEPDLGHVTLALGLRADYHAEPEAPSTDVSIDVVAPYRYLTDTASLRLRHMARDLAQAMLNRRLAILAKTEGAPFIRGSVSIGEYYNFYRDAGIDLTCAPGQWQAALGAAEQELRGALEYGFTQAELGEAVANFRNDLIQAASNAPTRRSDELANEIVQTLVDRTVFTTPAADLDLYGPALAKVTPEECANALRVAFGAPGRYVMVVGNARIEGDATAAIISAYQKARTAAVRPPPASASETFAYTNFGPPGRIAAQRRVPDLDLIEASFANGVRANVKRTGFEDNRVHVSVRVGAGELTAPPSQPGLPFFADLTFLNGGLGRHSIDELQRILAGKTVALEFKVGEDALRFSATTNREDLLLQLQVISAYLTDPGYRPEAVRQARKDIVEAYNDLDHSVDGPLQTEVPFLLASGDPRFGLPARDTLLSRSVAEEKAWLTPQLATGPIEIGIVGDLDPASALAAVASTLGALPHRAPKPAYAGERKVAFPSHPFSKLFTVPTEIPKAVVALYWPTTDGWNIQRRRRLSLLAEIFSDRLRVKIREQLGGAYDPGAASVLSETYTGYGSMVAEVVVAPSRTGEIAAAILKIAGDLQRNGVTPDELERAKRPLLTQVREDVRTNPYWLGAVLAECQEYPQRLAWSRSMLTDYPAMTKSDMDALAKAYLAPERAFQFVVVPR